jgi:Na+/melibiose symporter-like transporter
MKKIINFLLYILKIISVGIWIPMVFVYPRMLDYKATNPILFWGFVIVMVTSMIIFIFALYLLFRNDKEVSEKEKQENFYHAFPEER